MGKTLKVSQDLDLPLDLVTESFAILAKKRVGKSYTARRIAEQLFQARMQVVVVDPKGDWWGMRSGADGKSPGLPILILGGERGDLPLEVQSGELVAKLVVEQRVSVVLDLSLFRKSEVATFMTAFAENLYRLKAREEFRTPMMLILDEADAVAPQRPQGGEERMLGAVEDIVRRGGQRGLGCGVVTQRAAVLNKNILTQTQVLITLRTIAPQDLAATDAWVDVHGTPAQRKELMDSLPSLPRGDAWFWSPGWPTDEGIFKRVHILPIETFDSGATPKAGEKRVEPKQRADVDLEVLRRKMAETVERAKASDPRELRRQLAEARAELARAQKPHAATPAPAVKSDPNLNELVRQLRKAVEQAMKFIVKINAEDFFKAGGEAVDQEAIEKAIRSAVANVTKMLDAKVEKRNQQIEHLRKEAGRILMSLRDLASENVGVEVSVKHNEPFTVSPTPAPRPRGQPGNGHDPDGAIPPAAERMLTALAVRHPTPLTRRQLATLAKYGAVDGGGFRNTLSVLSSKGLVEKRGDLVALSGEGLAYFNGALPPPQSPEEIRAMWRAELPPAVQRMFDVVLARAPRGITRAELAAATGYEAVDGGGFRNTLSVLSSNGLIQKVGDEVRAVEELIG